MYLEQLMPHYLCSACYGKCVVTVSLTHNHIFLTVPQLCRCSVMAGVSDTPSRGLTSLRADLLSNDSCKAGKVKVGTSQMTMKPWGSQHAMAAY